jgi:NAD(P)-dependent dehydrogenase (short-subunit alcohol dehydrogenase family)
MEGKTILITGSTDGIGKQTALELSKMGANVLLHGRNQNRGGNALEEIKKKTGNNKIEFFIADLSSQKQVRLLAEKIQEKHNRLDVLINNAGVYMKERQLTEDGLEMTFAVNHLSHFLLTYLLLDLLKKSSPSRIINISSIAHQSGSVDFDNLQGEKKFSSYGAYALSKLANILFTYKLAEKLKNTGVTVNCLHPGVINTKLLRAGFGFGGASLDVGAETPVYLAISLEVENITGRYFVKKKETKSSTITYDIKIRKKFWEISEKLAGIGTFN